MTHHIAPRLLAIASLAVVLAGCAQPGALVRPVTTAAPAKSSPAPPAVSDSLVAEATVQAYLASLTEWGLGADTDDLLAALTTADRDSFDRDRLRAQGTAGRSQVLRAAALGPAERTGSGLEIAGCIEIRDGLGLAGSADATWSLVPDEASPTGWAVSVLTTFETTDTCIRTVY